MILILVPIEFVSYVNSLLVNYFLVSVVIWLGGPK